MKKSLIYVKYSSKWKRTEVDGKITGVNGNDH